MECQKTDNLAKCNCTYPCSRKGLCCQCIVYHRHAGELPACYFDDRTEKTYDRSVAAFLRSQPRA